MAERNHTFEEVRLLQKNPGSLWMIINRALPFKINERHIYSKDMNLLIKFSQFFAAIGRNAAEISLHLAKKSSIAIPEEISVDLPPIDEPFNLRTVTCEEESQVSAT